MPYNHEALLSAIEAIYDAAAVPELWPVALDRIAECVGAMGAALQDQLPDGSFAILASPGLQAATSEYQQSWWRQDIRAHRALERGLFLNKGYSTDLDAVTAEEMRSHPLYTDFLPRHGLGVSLAVAVRLSPRVIVSLGAQRAAGGPPFSTAEIEQLQRLAKHVEKALRLSARLFDSEAVARTLGDTLGRLGAGIFLLDGDARVVFANAAAERAAGAVLRIANRHLEPRDGRDRARLDAALTEAIRASPPAPRPQPILLHDPRSRRSLVLYVISLAARQPGTVLQSFRPAAHAAVLTIDPGATASHDGEALRELFGLTASEARLAAQIGNGKSPREAAAALDITEQTARVVLKRVFGKAGVRRQNELAALIGRTTLLEP